MKTFGLITAGLIVADYLYIKKISSSMGEKHWGLFRTKTVREGNDIDGYLVRNIGVYTFIGD